MATIPQQGGPTLCNHVYFFNLTSFKISRKYTHTKTHSHTMIILPTPSSGIAAVVRPPPTFGLFGSVPLPWESYDRDLPPGEMNDPVDTYASTTSCMQDQLNRPSPTTLSMISMTFCTRYRTINAHLPSLHCIINTPFPFSYVLQFPQLPFKLPVAP